MRETPGDAPSERGGARVDAKRRRSIPAALAVALLVAWVLAELILAVVAVHRERWYRKICLSNLKCPIGYSAHLYSTDFQKRGSPFPPTIGHLFPTYVNDGECFLCPSAGKATEMVLSPSLSRDNYTPAMFGGTHTDYVYVSGLRATDPPEYVLAFDDEWNHGGEGAYAVHIGGQILWLSDFGALHEQLDEQKKELAAQGREMKLLRPAWSSWADPPAGMRPRPWYTSFGGRVVAVGASAALVAAIALLVRKLRRDRSGPPRSDDGAEERAPDGAA
ncbi:MAG: hypothetical protein ACYTKD_02025 [Planctomycetota bacterium]|jgi:hypothetical protein